MHTHTFLEVFYKDMWYKFQRGGQKQIIVTTLQLTDVAVDFFLFKLSNLLSQRILFGVIFWGERPVGDSTAWGLARSIQQAPGFLQSSIFFPGSKYSHRSIVPRSTQWPSVCNIRPRLFSCCLHQLICFWLFVLQRSSMSEHYSLGGHLVSWHKHLITVW